MEKRNLKWAIINDFIGKSRPEEVAALIEIMSVEKYSTEDIGLDTTPECPWENKFFYKPLAVPITGKWRNFSFVECVWFRLVKELKGYYLPDASIFNVRKIMLPAYRVFHYRAGRDFDLVSIVAEENLEMAKKHAEQGLIYNPALWVTVKCRITELCEYLAKCICGQAPISLIVKPNGEFNVIDDRTPEGANPEWNSYIKISIYKILEEILLSRKFSESVLKIRQLQLAETQLMRLLREDGLEKITATVNKNKKITKITQLIRHRGWTLKQIEDWEKENKYGKIENKYTENNSYTVLLSINKKTTNESF